MFHRYERCPFRSNRIEVDRISVRDEERFNIDLILRAEGDHLGENQSFGSGNFQPSIEPRFANRRIEDMGIERNDGLHPIDPDVAAIKDDEPIRRPTANDVHDIDFKAIRHEVFQQARKG